MSSNCQSVVGKPQTQPIIIIIINYYYHYHCQVSGKAQIITKIQVLSQKTTTMAKIDAMENMLIFEMGIQIYPKRENFAVQPLNYLQILERKIHDKSVEIEKDDLMRW